MMKLVGIHIHIHDYTPFKMTDDNRYTFILPYHQYRHPFWVKQLEESNVFIIIDKIYLYKQWPLFCNHVAWNWSHIVTSFDTWLYNDIGPSLFSRPTLKILIVNSYTLSRKYQVAGNRYSRLFYSTEDKRCANLCVQEQSTNMTSQIHNIAFAWRHI